MAKQDDYTRYTIRVPSSLYAAIEKAAQDADRSINAEIIQRLELAMSEDIWERQKFIDTLNFKQHIIDKQMHMLSELISEKNNAIHLLQSQKAISASTEVILRLICLSISVTPSSPPQLKEMADEILEKFSQEDELDREGFREKFDLIKSIGDRDDIEPDWESRLSDADKARLSEARKWVKDDE